MELYEGEMRWCRRLAQYMKVEEEWIKGFSKGIAQHRLGGLMLHFNI